MLAFASAVRQLAPTARRRFVSTTLPSTRRQASTIPHHFDAPHYSFKEKLARFVPTESYPLIAFVACMSTYAVYSGVHAFGAVPGELRLTPTHLKQEKKVEPWEDPRALAGRW